MNGLYTLTIITSYVPSVVVFEIEECREAVIFTTGVVAVPVAQWLLVT